MVHEQHQNLIELNSISLEGAKFVEFSHDIVKIRYDEREDEISLDDARRHTDAMYRLRNSKPCHVIFNTQNMILTISPEAREYFAKDPRHSAIRLSQAIIIDNLAQRITGNFYKNIHKPSCPVKLFVSEMEAIKWTLSLQD